MYNSSGKKLTPVELRNATYHGEDFHKMLFTIAGEGDDSNLERNTSTRMCKGTQLHHLGSQTRHQIRDTELSRNISGIPEQ